MKKAYLAFACVILAPMMLVSVSSSAVYDPWVDLDESGDIDIFDVVTLAGSYQTTGDPTKNVNVLNWPVTNQQTVWYTRTTDGVSGEYNASGFGHMHITWQVGGLTGDEAVTLRIFAMMYYPGGSRGYIVQSMVITAATYQGALSFPVPSETFYFSLDLADGTTATVYFAFYLTYA
jgi:hypothetical protein